MTDATIVFDFSYIFNLGSLHPSIQDGNGRPRRDPSTIIQILRDLLSATNQQQFIPEVCIVRSIYLKDNFCLEDSEEWQRRDCGSTNARRGSSETDLPQTRFHKGAKNARRSLF